MTRRKRSAICYTAYVSGGFLLSLVGPQIWNVDPLVAFVAAWTTALCFAIGHIFIAVNARSEDKTAQLEIRNQDFEDGGRPIEPGPPAPDNVQDDDDIEARLRALVQRVSERCSGSASRRLESSEHALQAMITDAVAHSRVRLHLQPIVQLPSRQTVHYEALSRIRDANGKVIMPAEFLPAAARAGLGGALENMQLAQVISLCRQIGGRHEDTRIFCNLSQAAVADHAFRRELLGFLGTHRALVHRLIFELSAASLNSLDDDALADMSALEALGFHMSVDDVSLSELPDLRTRFENIAFTKINADEILAADAARLSQIANGGVQIIAVRVESERQAVALLDAGIGFGQGFLFGKPRPARVGAGAETQPRSPSARQRAA